MKELERAESISFLCLRTGQNDEESTETLAKALGDLPLAIGQAGAYIESRRKTFQSCHELLDNYQKELLSWRPKDAQYAPAVAATGRLLLTKLKRTFLRVPIFSI